MKQSLSQNEIHSIAVHEVRVFKLNHSLIWISVNAQYPPRPCPLCPPGTECAYGRCIPCNQIRRPVFMPMGNRPIVNVGPVVGPPFPINRPLPLPLPINNALNNGPIPINNGPIPINNGPIFPGGRAPFVGPAGLNAGGPLAGPIAGPVGVNQFSPPICGPGFRLFNNQCIRSGASSLSSFAILNVAMMIIYTLI